MLGSSSVLAAIDALTADSISALSDWCSLLVYAHKRAPPASTLHFLYLVHDR